MLTFFTSMQVGNKARDVYPEWTNLGQSRLLREVSGTTAASGNSCFCENPQPVCIGMHCSTWLYLRYLDFNSSIVDCTTLHSSPSSMSYASGLHQPILLLGWIFKFPPWTWATVPFFKNKKNEFYKL